MKKTHSSLLKWTIVSAMIGVFSPSVSIKTVSHANSGLTTAPYELSVTLLHTAEARGRRGGGARRSRPAGRRGGTHRRSRPSGVQRNRASRNQGRHNNRKASSVRSRDVKRNRNVNKNVNRNVNRNINVNHNYYGGGHHHHHGHYGYYGGRPILAFAGAVAIGSIIAAATMPSTCSSVTVNGTTYKKCDGNYYQPIYQGDTLVYKVVASPY